MAAEYILGIDLGTTNTVIAYAALESEEPDVQLLPIPQLVDFGTREDRTALPSFLYLATEPESTPEHLGLPWDAPKDYAVGEFARRQSASFPDRTVSAAKSWLCHARLDRHSAILPWHAAEDVRKISPVEATRRYLAHVVAAWNAAFPDAPASDQQVVLTVPASFDASARELTREAALGAGLPEDLVLFEEPQSAVYAWLLSIGDEWRKRVQVGDRLLVCDVGGGTTDLTLIDVAAEDGDLVLQRRAVGNHLLVGGDNMDLALAHFVSERFREQDVDLDPWQSVALWHQCRAAKESLLTGDDNQTQTISVKGRGSRLIGGAVTVEVHREEVRGLLIDGFFPQCSLQDRPARQYQSGFQEVGLPYESDPSITRHLAQFLGQHGEPDAPVRPTHLLFNGGVFRAEAMRGRVADVVRSWFDSDLSSLDGAIDLDDSVALGAAFYGWSKHRGSIRVRGGTARSYYIGIETAGLAIPGGPRPLQALCVVPFGMEEGSSIDVPSREIGLVVGEPARFRFFGSAVRKEDPPGQILPRWSEEELFETDSLELELPADDAIQDRYVPVKFHSRITELGIFELWCVSTQTEARWKLEFSVRDAAE